MKRFPSSRCASAIQIVRPLELIAETQPQRHPALLGLRAMLSHYSGLTSVLRHQYFNWNLEPFGSRFAFRKQGHLE